MLIQELYSKVNKLEEEFKKRELNSLMMPNTKWREERPSYIN